MRDRIKPPLNYQNWMQLEPDAVYRILAKLATGARNLARAWRDCRSLPGPAGAQPRPVRVTVRHKRRVG